MKKVWSFVLLIICWVGAIIFFLSIDSFKDLDPWGLVFTFCTVPSGIIGVLLLVKAIKLTKKFVTKKM